MREIKFRAWDKLNQIMINDFLRVDEHALIMTSGTPSDYQGVMQFTGLLDKNGREIYEGDRVTGYTSYENDNDRREWTMDKPANVYWDEGFCAFYPFYLNARWRCNVVEIEVIGNVHENPELVGK